MKNSAGSDGLSFAPGNAQAQGKRSDQQDSFGFSDPADAAFLVHGGLLAVVADGMGVIEYSRKKPPMQSRMKTAMPPPRTASAFFHVQCRHQLPYSSQFLNRSPRLRG